MKLLSLILMASFCLSSSALADAYIGSDLSEFIQNRMRNHSNSAYSIPNGLHRENRDEAEKKVLARFLSGRDYKANPRLAVEDARTLVSFSDKMLLAIQGEFREFESTIGHAPGREYVARYVSPRVFLDLIAENVLNDRILGELASNPFAYKYAASSTNLLSELEALSARADETLTRCGPRLVLKRWREDFAHLYMTRSALEEKLVSMQKNTSEIATKASGQAAANGGRLILTGTKRSYGFNSYTEMIQALENLAPDPAQARQGGKVAQSLTQLVLHLFFEEADDGYQAIHPELLESATGEPLDRWVYRNSEGEWRVSTVALAESDFRDWVVIQLDRLFRTRVAKGKQADLVEQTLGSLKLDWKRYPQVISEQFLKHGLERFFPAFEANKSHMASFQNEISSAEFLADFRRLALLDILGISSSPTAVAKRISGLPTAEVRKSLLFVWNSGDSITRAGLVQLFQQVLADGAAETTLERTRGLAILMNDPGQASQLFTDVARKLGGKIRQDPKVAAEFQGVVKYLFHEGGVRRECSVWLN